MTWHFKIRLGRALIQSFTHEQYFLRTASRCASRKRSKVFSPIWNKARGGAVEGNPYSINTGCVSHSAHISGCWGQSPGPREGGCPSRRHPCLSFQCKPSAPVPRHACEHQGQRLRTRNSALPALRGGGTQAWKRAVECQSLRSEASRRPSNSTRQIAAPASCKAASVWLKDLTNWSRHSYGIRKSGIPTTFS